MEEGSLWKTPARWLTSFDGVIRYIESQGYECVPYAPLDAPRMPKCAVRDGLCAPNGVRLSIEYAAVAAGLAVVAAIKRDPPLSVLVDVVFDELVAVR